RRGPRELEMDGYVRAGEQFTCRIVHVHLDQQGAGGQIDRVRVANEGTGESAAGKFIERERGRRAVLGRLFVVLRDADEHTQPIDGRYVEQLFAGAVGLNQGADVGAARCDDPVERRIDLLVRLQVLEPFDVSGGGIHN